MEIYNEILTDLLNNLCPKLEIREDKVFLFILFSALK